MKTIRHIALFFALTLLAACKTQQNVIYLQDLEDNAVIQKAQTQVNTLKAGDKLSILVTSAATPEQALRYNLSLTMSKSGNYFSQYQDTYTISDKGTITVPGLPEIMAVGKTRSELQDEVQAMLRQSLLHDATVVVNCVSRFVYIMGEVRTPGRVEFTRDDMTILEALGTVGDLNIQAKRNNIIVLREEDGVQKHYAIDLRTKDLFQSPAYYLKSNDVIYVQPNKVRQGQSTVNDNSFRSIATWLSMASVVTSITILITNAVNNH